MPPIKDIIKIAVIAIVAVAIISRVAFLSKIVYGPSA